jgi:membrane-bound lytic murein transglycosylase D
MMPLDFFLRVQIMLAAAALLASAFRFLGRRGWYAPKEELRVHYALLALFAVLLFTPMPGGENFAIHKVAHVEVQQAGPQAGARSVLVIPGTKAAPLSLDWAAWLTVFATLTGMFFTARDYLQLRSALQRVVVFRQIGRVRVAVSESAASPYSARWFGLAYVVLPDAFLQDPLRRRVALAHELQHHRAGDTLWCHVFAPLRALGFFHPLRPLWFAAVSEAQELACDEVLVRQKKKISAGDYARCLVDAAESAARGGGGRAYAAAPSLFGARRLLVRRIESMMQRKHSNGLLALGLGVIAGALLTGTAWASGHWVIDSRVSGHRMLEMAEVARKGTDFPVVVNDRVLRELNRYLGTAKGREFTANAEANLARLKPMLDSELGENKVPDELLAVGFIESGFQNLLQSHHPAHSAGVWQFIPNTARTYGLRVDEELDERLDQEKETSAAFRYLANNQARFGDWLLAVMAYNAGEKALGAAIAKYGTRDPFKLVELGFEGDQGYLARFMAGVLILKNK